MLLRYADRPLSLLGIGCVLAAGSPASIINTVELDVPPRAPPPRREISRQAVNGIFYGLACIGFTLIFCDPARRRLGGWIAIIAGCFLLVATFGNGWAWDYAEYREEREAREDKAKLERVLGALQAPLSAQGMIAGVVYGGRDTVSVDTKYGVLVVARTQGGYSISLGDGGYGEKSREVAMKRMKSDELGQQTGWVEQAVSLVCKGDEGERWEALLDLYR